MKYLRITVILSLTLLLLNVTALFAASGEQTYKAIRKDYVTLLGSPQAQRLRDNWLRVVAELEAFIASPQTTSLKDDAEFLRGRTWQGLAQASGRDADARKAIMFYEHLAKKFPESRLADDALISAAKIHLETFSDPSRAYHDYLRITTVLPPGDMYAAAQSHLKKLAKLVRSHVSVKKKAQNQTVRKMGQLTKIRIWSSPEYTRVVLDLSRKTDYESHQLRGTEPRIYLDLKGVDRGPGVVDKQLVADGIVTQVRSSTLDRSHSRVVLDLTRRGDYQIIDLTNPERIVIDVRKPSSRAVKNTRTNVPPKIGRDSIGGILAEVPAALPPALHVPQHKRKIGINLIVVDAGHGGKDPGAIGYHQTREKDVALQMAKKLATALRKGLGCKVLLTRSDDHYILLHDRTAYANKVGADLFISLHANASPNRHAYGLETYYLNLSKNKQAAEVAARENGTSLEEVGNLEAILFDLMANAKINESSRLAAEIQRALVRKLKPKFSHIKDLGVRQGPFHVLLGATMPSVLVETAFISNAREEKRLKTNAYQTRVAQAIVQGVKDYEKTIRQVAHQ